MTEVLNSGRCHREETALGDETAPTAEEVRGATNPEAARGAAMVEVALESRRSTSGI